MKIILIDNSTESDQRSMSEEENLEERKQEPEMMNVDSEELNGKEGISSTKEILEIERLKKELAESKQELTETKQELAEVRRKSDEKDKKIEVLEQESAEKDQRIAHLEEKFAQLEKESDEKDQRIAHLEEKFALLEQTLLVESAEKDRMNALLEDVYKILQNSIEKDRVNALLNIENAARIEVLEEYKKTCNTLRNEKEKLEELYQDLMEQYRKSVDINLVKFEKFEETTEKVESLLGGLDMLEHKTKVTEVFRNHSQFLTSKLEKEKKKSHKLKKKMKKERKKYTIRIEELEKKKKKKNNHPCSVCGKLDAWVCSRCKSVFYCSRECQIKDWKEHINVCKQK